MQGRYRGGEKEITIDIEDMFKHLSSVDKQNIFTVNAIEIRTLINQLPETVISPTLADIIPEKHL